MLSKTKTCLLAHFVFSFLFSSSCSADYKSSSLLCASMMLVVPLATYLDQFSVNGQFHYSDNLQTLEEYVTFIERIVKSFQEDVELEFTQKRLSTIYNELTEILTEFEESPVMAKLLQQRVQKIITNVKSLQVKLERKMFDYFNKEVDGLVGELDLLKSSGVAGVDKAIIDDMKDNFNKLRTEVKSLTKDGAKAQLKKVDSIVKNIFDMVQSLKTRNSSVLFDRLYFRALSFHYRQIWWIMDAFKEE